MLLITTSVSVMTMVQPTPSAEKSLDGYNFINEAKKVFRAIACWNSTQYRKKSKNSISDHCRKITRRMNIYRDNYARKALSFFRSKLPDDLPGEVVYPFGGCDLFSILLVYPKLTEVTTISLESSGDPRVMEKAHLRQFKNELREFRQLLCYHLITNNSSNRNVRNSDDGMIPGQLVFSLVAAKIHGYRPISLKYFKLKPDGTLHYYSRKEIDVLKYTRGKRLALWMKNPGSSIAFRNMEIIYQRYDNTFTHRHIASNLHNKYIQGSSLQKHLEKKGKISSLIKAASYLVWFDSYSVIRNYLLSNMKFMVSDATGILPKHAQAAGFEQITYGKFHGAFLKNYGGANAAAFRKCFRSQPYRPVSFMFGHADIFATPHLIITRTRKKKN